MGCDIHAYMEYRKSDKDFWRGWPRINLGRNYAMFGKLAGVRSSGPAIVKPRGIPHDIGYDATHDWWLLIDDKHADSEAFCSQAQAENYPKYGSRIQAVGEGGNKYACARVEHPDWHTPSWVSAEELVSAISAVDLEYPGDCLEYRAMAAAMKAVEAQDYECRLVFWFDN